MKNVSWITASVGVLIVLIAFFVRFHQEPAVAMLGGRSGSILLVGNTIILVGVFFAVLTLKNKTR